MIAPLSPTWFRLDAGAVPKPGGMQKFFSQLGEDCLLGILFEFKTRGFFVDVGAFDGIYLSNSYAFEQLGWSGICVEAHPDYFELCINNRLASKCVHAACLARGQGAVEFRAERGGLFSGTNADESFTASVYRGQGVQFDGFRTISVPSISLNELLTDTTAEIDFVSIDVEGAELEVLKGFDLERYQPRLLVIEANKQEERDALCAYLDGRGYRLARSMAWNHFFVHRAEDVKALQEIGFMARLERAAHPLGRVYNRVGDAVDPIVRWPATT
jgi:FkbM family methyltransferase